MWIRLDDGNQLNARLVREAMEERMFLESRVNAAIAELNDDFCLYEEGFMDRVKAGWNAFKNAGNEDQGKQQGKQQNKKQGNQKQANNKGSNQANTNAKSSNKKSSKLEQMIQQNGWSQKDALKPENIKKMAAALKRSGNEVTARVKKYFASNQSNQTNGKNNGGDKKQESKWISWAKGKVAKVMGSMEGLKNFVKKYGEKADKKLSKSKNKKLVKAWTTIKKCVQNPKKDGVQFLKDHWKAITIVITVIAVTIWAGSSIGDGCCSSDSASGALDEIGGGDDVGDVGDVDTDADVNADVDTDASSDDGNDSSTNDDQDDVSDIVQDEKVSKPFSWGGKQFTRTDQKLGDGSTRVIIKSLTDGTECDFTKGAGSFHRWNFSNGGRGDAGSETIMDNETVKLARSIIGDV